MTLPGALSTHFIGPLPPLPSLDGYSNPGAPYTVDWDLGCYETFPRFIDALRFMRGMGQARLLGRFYDDESDGLTDLEREWVEAVEAGEEVPNV